ncbi:methyltransferase domain-containing protein [Shewanella maritima]|uniref:methyltransferase domain-containing protein n=1 Tax=Shewanella maritima TaxID=2520507 RepID=UPI00373604FA
MNALPLSCPICREQLQLHVASNGFYCVNQHHIDPSENGVYSLLISKKHKLQSVSRQQMRTKQFLLASGLYDPLVDTVNAMVAELPVSEGEMHHLDYQCADGFFLRAIVNACKQDWHHWGVSDAENALFSAAKQQTPGRLLLGTMKRLPFTDASMDLITVIDSPLKGKECLRVLKPDGKIIVVIPDTRHLWELKQIIYPNLEDKPLQLNLPKGLAVDKQIDVNVTQRVSAQQAKDLLSMASFSWRVDSNMNHELLQCNEMDVQFAWKVLLLSVS